MARVMVPSLGNLKPEHFRFRP